RGARGRAAGAAPDPTHPAGHHGPPHRSQASDRAGEAPADLPAAGGAGVAPVDAPRAGAAAAADRPGDHAPLDDGRATPGEADGGAGGVLGAPLLQRDPFRSGTPAARQAGPRADPVLSRRAVRRAAVLSAGLLGGRRPRRQSLRLQRGDPSFPVRVPPGGAPPLPAAPE